jgi:hypothetical protein
VPRHTNNNSQQIGIHYLGRKAPQWSDKLEGEYIGIYVGGRRRLDNAACFRLALLIIEGTTTLTAKPSK